MPPIALTESSFSASPAPGSVVPSSPGQRYQSETKSLLSQGEAFSSPFRCSAAAWSAECFDLEKSEKKKEPTLQCFFHVLAYAKKEKKKKKEKLRRFDLNNTHSVTPLPLSSSEREKGKKT